MGERDRNIDEARLYPVGEATIKRVVIINSREVLIKGCLRSYVTLGKHNKLKGFQLE